jgi:hypothetical protein
MKTKNARKTLWNAISPGGDKGRDRTLRLRATYK